ncbi:hypothetical protein Tco_1120302, partial [Tanacetum coccineum]
TWKTFGENTRDLGSILEETNKSTTLYKRRLEELLTEGGDGVRILATPSWLSSNRIRKFVTVSGL